MMGLIGLLVGIVGYLNATLIDVLDEWTWDLRFNGTTSARETSSGADVTLACNTTIKGYLCNHTKGRGDGSALFIVICVSMT